MHIFSVALLSRSFGRFADMTIKVPIVVRYDRSTKRVFGMGILSGQQSDTDLVSSSLMLPCT